MKCKNNKNDDIKKEHKKILFNVIENDDVSTLLNDDDIRTYQTFEKTTIFDSESKNEL